MTHNVSRHIGDFGNLVVTDGGVVRTSFTDSVISLHGANRIINRVIVIHVGEDDLGKGGDVGSTKTGNAGPRLACCQIKEVDDTVGGGVVSLLSGALLCLSILVHWF